MDGEGANARGADEGPSKLTHLGDARDQAGSMVGVSNGYVSYAARVKEDAPAAFEELRAGTITMPQATVIARAPVDERAAMTTQTVARNAAPPTPRQPRTGEPLHRARMGKLTIDERARYEVTVYRALRATPWRAMEAMSERGEATTVKLTVIGKPGTVFERGDVVLVALRSEKAPSFPKGVPAPESPAVDYIVLVGNKQWSRVAQALTTDPADNVLIEGYPTVRPDFAGITVHATSAAMTGI